MKKILSLTMAFLLSASVCLFSSCQYIDGLLDAFPSFPSDKTECTAHSFGEWETVKEASCIAGEKQRVCETCDFKETEEIPALNDFFAHSFDENTLCTTCGHQEFIKSEEYIEPIKLSYYGRPGYDGILWWNKDKTYGLKILYFNARSHAIIKGFEGTPVHIQLPAYYDEIPITYINQPDEGSGLGTFQNCTTLKSIYIPDTITRIEDYAFDGCTNLESVRFSENLTNIEQCVFRNCTSLQSVFLKNNKSTLSFFGASFENCTSLQEVYFPSNHICWVGGDTTMKNCTSLEKIYISEERYDYFTKQFIPYYPDLQIISYK